MENNCGKEAPYVPLPSSACPASGSAVCFIPVSFRHGIMIQFRTAPEAFRWGNSTHPSKALGNGIRISFLSVVKPGDPRYNRLVGFIHMLMRLK